MNLYQKLQEKPFLIAGPCVIESEELVLEVAEFLQQLQKKYPDFVLIFKASFDKANRTSVDAFRGPGIEKGLAILKKVKDKYGLPLLTDIHEPNQAEVVGKVVDILQIPAFLCRQTDLLLAASATNCIVNIKKAQFLSGKDMVHVVNKVSSTGNRQILLTERGTMFGYNNLVVDYTGILDMMDYGYPVVMDATHSVQKPGGEGGKSGGNRAYAPLLAQAAAAIGIRGYFVETHPTPDLALSDGPNMLTLDALEKLVENLQKIHQLKLS
ncbi:MAG: 2-Keto-3-deoxy-D-manno-octulosonate-8-phosphate synthase (EC [uncultured Aureispira sp.]|uniref:2-dehydro-3-deoxyphosphooctonate aldolase n=1 Tax=uncultured Aureispira sp. TaxID=1331704 RepID=A0A6S6SDB6_9BACT|nr:MAG: 2-Keto-3-deoxy-D-manno-octulosonate-8-phosphate synthase (EC [uncultured Aureispira sp.]